MRNKSFLTLLIVICSLSLCLIGCPDPFMQYDLQKTANGEGYFSLQTGGGGRTIMPGTVLETSLFDGYTLVFTSSSFPSVTVERTNDDLTHAVTLSVGTWNLEITAYALDTDGETKLPLARGSITGILITNGANTTKSVELKPITSGGTGTFSWDITLPSDIVRAYMTITPDAGGGSVQTLWLADNSGANTVTSDNSIDLNSGIYRLALTLSNGAVTRVLEEYLHIYRNMESAYTNDFTGVFTVIAVTSEADSGAGTLRNAISNPPAYSMIYIADNVKTIRLTSTLYIDQSLVIEGNGVTITRDPSWSYNDSLLRINSSFTVNISRVHFKDGRGSEGGAIYNSGILTVESCIFSDNQATRGGAILNFQTMTVKGCTFYGNSSTSGGAIWQGWIEPLTLTGNLFYGNTASNQSPVVYNGYTNSSSGGYNIVDVVLGTGYTQSGWTTATTDKLISSLPISGKSFKLLQGSEAANVITTLPAGYPAFDFYGNPITNGAAAGAVQSSVTGSGYYLELSVNNVLGGTINASPEPDADGLCSGTITLTATAETGYSFAYWLVDGVKQSGNSLTVTSQSKVQAVFSRTVTVTSSEDTDTSGTLRYALNTAQDGDIISLSGVTTIELIGYLYINNSITIEGNGVTITRSASSTNTSSLLRIYGGTVNISRVYFKDGRGSSGGAIYNGGTLTVESCIFSGNKATGYGGAINNENLSLTMKGCTFYGNSSNYGGAVMNMGGTLTLTGNLFYGNTAINMPVINPNGRTVISGGYNVVDIALGTSSTQSGFAAVTGDKTVSSLPISGTTFKLLSGSGAASVITTLPAGYPSKDFYGNTIANGAAAGAVQSSVSGSGYYIDLSVNNVLGGTINTSPAPDSDGLHTGTTTLTAVAETDYSFEYWLVDGVKQNGNPLTVTSQAKVQAVFTRTVTVNSSADTNTSGTLRYAIENAQDGDKISISGVTTIELTSELTINKNITIEGNGAVITRNTSFTNTNSLLYINSGTVNIIRVHFKDGRGSYDGGAIQNQGILTVESCIFSGNQATGGGGAICAYGTLTVKGCTFYGNSSSYGGAIYYGDGTLNLTGNLFYGNTANSYPVVYGWGTLTSGGYNVVNVAFGTGTAGNGWTAATGDKTINSLPISAKSFRLFTDSGAADVITNLPEGYPSKDFYGDTITDGAAAGAVQSSVSGSGYYVEISLNNSSAGTVNISPAPDADGLCSGTTTLTTTAQTGYSFAYWLVDGVRQNGNTLTITSQAKITAVFTRTVTITSSEDTNTSGTLRYALSNAQDGDIISLSGVTTIELTSALTLNKNITIEGNGVTITQSAGSTNTNSLLRISGVTVNISRVHFKDGRSDNGGAIYNTGILTVESCIFSGNQSSSSYYAYGGAVYNLSGTLTVKGCTFYGNTSIYYSGAIYNSNSSGILNLTGNLFYGNTANYYPVVYRSSGTLISGGYNVVDVAFGTSSTQSGWTAATGDKTISSLPISAKSFKLLSSDSGAANVITTLPEGYPSKDFYGNTISNGAAAGAVQSVVSGSGYYLDLTVNNTSYGSTSISSSSNADGLYSGSVTMTANAASGYAFAYWLIDGSIKETANPYTLTLNHHTMVKAVFAYTVSSSSDSSDSATTSGTLRYAITNAQNGDIISISGVTAIELTEALPQIYRNITIEGNGVTLTRNADWTATDSSSQLLYVNSSSVVVNISRVHFKGGRATYYGGAIYNYYGNLTLESCIFSDNLTSTNYGGAVYNYGTLTVKGCTFYGNASSGVGGAIYSSGTLTLTGNLFYGNTATNGYPVVYPSGTRTSGGYNVVDVAFGTSSTQNGWTAATGDTTISSLPISTTTFKLLSGSGAANVITTLPEGYPSKDFYGNAITDGAAAGAVQATASGYNLALTANNSNYGSASISSSPNADGLYTGSVTMTANASSAYVFAYWLIDGSIKETANPYTFTINHNTTVQAAFAYPVTSSSDVSGSAYTPGTLRYAITNAQNGDVINLSGVTTIELTEALPQITRSITIEGNGVTLTRSASWTTTSNSSQLLLSSGTVQINRVHFKGGRATDYGAAVSNGGTLTLESCIFSDNRTSASDAYGGAIYSSGTMTVKGCTFFGNASYRGGAIYHGSGTLTLTGNLFYGNTATNSGPVVYRSSGTVTSGGYNVVDVALGTGTAQSGWTAAISDTTLMILLGSNTTTPFVNTTAFEPLAGIRGVMPSTAIEGFPTTDFNGAVRTWTGAPGAVK
jgi:predicted outer membrane repeat protein